MKHKLFIIPCILLSCIIICGGVGASSISTDTIMPVINYQQAPVEYEIGGIQVLGADFSDANAIIAVSGLRIGNKIRIPGEDIGKAVRSLWKLKLFSDIRVIQESVQGSTVFLTILLKEHPRMGKHSFTGVKKSQHDDLNDIVTKHLPKGTMISENKLSVITSEIQNFYKEKGYLDPEVKIRKVLDTSALNSQKLIIAIAKNKKVKIQNITFAGNTTVKARKLRKQMDDTHRKAKLFSSSKLITSKYEADKKKIIEYYNKLGYRDAKITSDSLWRETDGDLMIHMNIVEGNPYYFRNITWKGNSIYDSELLGKVLGIKKGEKFNHELLDRRLQFSQDGRDVSSLYLDNGYLFFRADPKEISITNDSIDIEVRIYEGPLATIDKIVIKGNDRTHEEVIRRELRTLPGAKFSRADIIRSQREIINLGYFNPETVGINPIPNPSRGTVDIEYTLEEKPSDQLELSAGWAGAQGLIGTLGVTFNNFSLRNILNRSSWHPLPTGDGQRLSLRAQRNTKAYQSYNVSFTEPWLGGTKPTSLTVGGYYTRNTNGLESSSPNYNRISLINGSISLGTRLKKPDDNFIANVGLNFQTISIQNYFAFDPPDGEPVRDGSYKNWNLKLSLARNTIVDPIFPKSGALFELSSQLTLPYSLFKDVDDYSELSPQARYGFIEYHKWKFRTEWYTPLWGKFVFKTSAKFGMLGSYNSKLGLPPFERFELGGDGLSNGFTAFLGNDIISLRGYDLTDVPNSLNGGAALYDKLTMELRYPVSLAPTSTIYLLGFLEGGNSWKSFKTFNPFDLKRSAGVGLRVFLPMFGTLGFDYGLGFDKLGVPKGSPWSQYGRFSIILGFEPD